jgi:PEP-CTERM motif
MPLETSVFARVVGQATMPEPGALALLALGLAGFAYMRRKQ